MLMHRLCSSVPIWRKSAEAEVAPAAAIDPASASSRAFVLTAVLLLGMAVLLRGPSIGDPALSADESFYLLVADRMWQGALPYVDIFDRKPIGLFLLYAAFRPFSSDGIVAYQVAALLFASATAFVIARLASRFVCLPAAALAGAVYLLYLPIVGGGGGQSPVFYNLFMALAALLIVKSDESSDGWRRLGLTAGAMLLVGCAIQVKTSVLIEGAFFGCWLMYRDWARDRRLVGLAVHSLGWLVLAFIPSALAAGFYIAIGHWDAFLYANVLSALTKKEPAGFSEVPFLAASVFTMAPILVVSLWAGVKLVWRRPMQTSTAFVLLWSIASILGFFAIGHYYRHYALPALLPLSVLCATLDPRPIGIGLVGGLVLSWSTLIANFPQFESTSTHKARVAALVDALGPYTKYGCIYLNFGPPAVYLKTHSCLPTNLVFPEHLAIAAEATLGRGQAAMAALIAGRPSAVLFPDRELTDWYDRPLNTGNQALLAAALAKNYHLKMRLRDPTAAGYLQLFVRNDLP